MLFVANNKKQRQNGDLAARITYEKYPYTNNINDTIYIGQYSVHNNVILLKDNFNVMDKHV